MSDDFVDEIERRDELVLLLGGRNRRQRQEAAHELAGIARTDPTLIAEVTEDLIAALELPEAQTRWECLDALSEVVPEFPQRVEGAFDGAEESLFDEGSSSACLAAFRFLSLYGSQSAEASLRAWPLIREAVQCYHGDAEYRDMLICLLGFARGSIAPEVGDSLAECMAYDAKNGTGFYRAYSSEICAAIKEHG